jgi:hypothetical protein
LNLQAQYDRETADSEMQQRDRSNAVGDSRVIRRETRMEPKPVRSTKHSHSDREEADRLHDKELHQQDALHRRGDLGTLIAHP